MQGFEKGVEERRQPAAMAYTRLRLPEGEMLRRARRFHASVGGRKNVRSLSPEPVPRALVESALETAATAPATQGFAPWRSMLVGDAETRGRLRLALAVEGGDPPPEPRGGWRRTSPILETLVDASCLEAPWIVAAFEEEYVRASRGDGRVPHKNFHVKQSFGMACGFFIAALRVTGLATLAYAPRQTALASEILGLDGDERSLILFPVGYPADGVLAHHTGPTPS